MTTKLAYPHRPDCPECEGSGSPKTCHACYTEYRLMYEAHTAVPCPVCGKPKKRKSTMCRECYKGGKTNDNVAAWSTRRVLEDKARKAKSIDFLSDSSGRVVSRQSIVRCFYHRGTRRNILAWNINAARKYAVDQGWAVDDIIHSRCAVSQVNVNITGIDLTAIGNALQQTG